MILQIVFFSRKKRDPECMPLYVNTEESHHLIEESRRKKMGISHEDAKIDGIDDDELDILNDDDDDFDESELDFDDDDDDFDDDDDEAPAKPAEASENKDDDTEDEKSDENKEDK